MDISTYPYITITVLIKEVRYFAHEGFFFAAAKNEISLLSRAQLRGISLSFMGTVVGFH